MKSEARKGNVIGPLAKKVISEFKKTRDQKVIDFMTAKFAAEAARDLDKSVISVKKMAEYDPVHAAYIYAQNKLSVMVEQLGELNALTRLNNAYADADERYMPSGPPMSPMTLSYFTCWGFFDLCLGIQKETFATIAIETCRFLRVDEELIDLFECMQDSRMGLYLHRGVQKKQVILEDLFSGQRINAVVGSRYLGKPDELWFARVLPSPPFLGDAGYSVVFTTPYVLTEVKKPGLNHHVEAGWRAFLERTLQKTGIPDAAEAYRHFMKYGLNRHYWNEFIVDGYFNHQKDMILLAGYPDLPLTLPNSMESWDLEDD